MSTHGEWPKYQYMQQEVLRFPEKLQAAHVDILWLSAMYTLLYKFLLDSYVDTLHLTTLKLESAE